MIETEDGPCFRSVVKRCELALSRYRITLFVASGFLFENLVKKRNKVIQVEDTYAYRYVSLEVAKNYIYIYQ